MNISIATVRLAIVAWIIFLLIAPVIADQNPKFHVSMIESWPGDGISVDLVIDNVADQTQVIDEFLVLQSNQSTNLKYSIEKVSRQSVSITLVLLLTKQGKIDLNAIEWIKILTNNLSKHDEVNLYLWNKKLSFLGRTKKQDQADLKKLSQINIKTKNPNIALAKSQIVASIIDAIKINEADQSKARIAVILGGETQFIKTLKNIPTIQHITTSKIELVDAEKFITDINNSAQKNYFRMAICGLSHVNDIALKYKGNEQTIYFPDSRQLGDRRPCELEAILKNKREYPAQLWFQLTKSERKTYDNVVKNASRDDFNVTLRLYEDGPQYPLKAHLRGNGSLLKCRRKSYTIDLTGDDPWPLIQDTNANQFYLIAMCQDPKYLRTHTLYQLWNSLGLFPLKFRFVEMMLDQESRGIYMLVEKPIDALPRAIPGITGILRRGFVNPLETIEAKYTNESKDITIGNYTHAFMDIDYLQGEALKNQLDKVINVDQFITHLAAATILENGDYLDEIWMLEQQFLQDNGELSYRYEIMKWDPEDIFTDCHYIGKYAYQDPFNLVYCLESSTGIAIVQNPDLYEKLVNRIEELLMSTLSQESFTQAIDHTLNQLTSKLEKPGITIPMRQFWYEKQYPISNKAAINEMRAMRNTLVNRYIQRKHILQSRIKHYREKTNH